MAETWMSLHLMTDPRCMVTICEHHRLVTRAPLGLPIPHPTRLAELAVLLHAAQVDCICASGLWRRMDLPNSVHLCLLESLTLDRRLTPEELANLATNDHHHEPQEC